MPPPGQAPYGQPQQPYPYPQQGAQPGAPGQQQYGQNQIGHAPQGQNPFGQQAPPQGQNPYGQAQQPYPQQQYAQAGGGGCTLCGGFPAVQATVRGHQGFLVMMKFLKRRANFCRTCGIATHREMTTKTLWQGWWGIGSFIITPITVLMNFGPRGKFNKLPAPTGGVRPPLDPGKPIFARAGAFGAVIPLLVVAAIVAAALSSDSGAASASPGDCVVNNGSDLNPKLSVVDCTSSQAAYRVTGKHTGTHHLDTCSPGLIEYDETGRGDDFALCLTPLH